jgi:peptidylprolyl isomerase
VATLPNGRIFENSLERKAPFDVRIGTGMVVAGLDEALSTMRVGGVRRVYVPGNLSFPKPLKAAAGRPSVPANSPVIFDVQLLYIPGGWGLRRFGGLPNCHGRPSGMGQLGASGSEGWRRWYH